MGADRSQTVLATDRLITRFKEKGYEFVAIPQMMSCPGEDQGLGKIKN
jgi:hypothetical protein